MFWDILQSYYFSYDSNKTSFWFLFVYNHKNMKYYLKKEVMTMNSKFWDYCLLTLVIIGAVNWGLIGFFQFDLVAFLFGNMSWLSRIIYALVGISGLYLISAYGRIRSIG